MTPNAQPPTYGIYAPKCRYGFAVGRTQSRPGRFRLVSYCESIASRPLSVAGLGQFLPWRWDLSDLVTRLFGGQDQGPTGLVVESVRLDPAWTARVATGIATPSALEVINQAVRSVLRQANASASAVHQARPRVSTSGGRAEEVDESKLISQFPLPNAAHMGGSAGPRTWK